MDDISPFLRQQSGPHFFFGRRLTSVFAVLIAAISVCAWWVARSAESDAAIRLQQAEVEYGVSAVREELEESEKMLQQIESILEQEGIDSDRARTLIEESANRFEFLAVVQPETDDEIKFAFTVDDSIALSQRNENIVSAVANSSAMSKTAQFVAVPGDEIEMIVTGRPLDLRKIDDETKLSFSDNWLKSPIAPDRGGVLVAVLSVGLYESPSAGTLNVEVDGELLANTVEVDDESGLYSSTEFVVGRTNWSLSPAWPSPKANHVGSNLIWAAGVALTSLVFFFRSGVRSDVEELNDVLLHRYYRLTDPVTGFFNEEGVTKELEIRLQHRVRGAQVGVVLCQIDRLESIRNTLGRSAADGIVRTVFSEVYSQLEGSDSCGRVGDSKVLVMSNNAPTEADLERIAERLATRFADPLELVDGIVCHLSFSVGIASTQSSEASATDLILDASLACDQAAQRGGGAVVVFTEDKRREAAVGIQLQRELAEAVSEGALTVYYQGLFDTSEVAEREPVSKVEALVRWPHSRRGMVHPQVFLPLAAPAGVDLEITKFVLHEACSQAVAWSEEVGRPVSISVNIGERQLLDLRLVQAIDDALTAARLPAEQLEIDVTEDLLLRKGTGAKEVLEELALMGVGISLDDFGASSGSLQSLRSTANVSTVKIDRSFVAHIASNQVNQKVVAAVVLMAQQCGIDVIAEGVETEAQLVALRELGVGQAQGFLFHRPEPSEGVIEVLRSNSPASTGVD